jgi:glucose-1-phosphate thymidylyltransferase
MAVPAQLIGLVPAAGRGTRLGGIAGSKEMVPVPTAGSGASAPVSAQLLRCLAEAGVERAYVVLRTGKWDLPEYYAAHPPTRGPRLAYLMTPGTASIPATLDLAYPFALRSTVVLGFPDSCFQPRDALRRAVERHRAGSAAVTLALFPSDRPDKTDMVELDGDRVSGFRVKPGACELRFTFGAAVWGPDFTDFLHRFLAARERTSDPAAESESELQISQVLGAALRAGLAIDAEPSPSGRYVDLGTPDDLHRVRSEGVPP